MNFLRFCLSKNVFISPSILKNIFVSYRILGGQDFSCNTRKMSFHCLLAAIVSDEKLAIIFNFVPLYLICLFSLAAFKILSLCSVFSCLTMMFLCRIFFIFILELGFVSHFLKNSELLGNCYFRYFFLSSLSSLSGTPITHVLNCLILFYGSLTLCSFFLNIFSLFDNFY